MLIRPPRNDGTELGKWLTEFYQVYTANLNADTSRFKYATNYGFSPDASAANNTTFFNTAIDDMAAGDCLIVPPGTYSIDNGTVFDPPDDCSLLCQGVLKHDGNGIGFTIGDASGTTESYRYNVQGLRVTSTAKDHTSGRIGILLRNLYESVIDIRECLYHETGIKCLGSGSGFVYNELHFGRIVNNKFSLYLTAESSGWCNDNNFYGGRFNWTSAQDTSDFRHIWIDYYADEILDSNRFWGPSFESFDTTGSGTAACSIYCEGTECAFYSPRFELGTGDLPIELTSNSEYCFISPSAHNLPDLRDIYVKDSGKHNLVFTNKQIYFRGSNADTEEGVVQFLNTNSNTKPAIVVFDSTGATANIKLYGGGNVDFAGVVKIDGTQVVGPRVVDARIDDALNSGDATTDGVIDAIRDALITHGLIAAA